MIRVFPRRTSYTPNDDLAFIGDPGLFRPSSDLPVKVSCTFTWDIEEAERLKRSWSVYYSNVEVGGPAYDDAGDEFVSGRFLKIGYTITSRGCVKECEWCFVPKREGKLRAIEIKPGWIVNDNNLIACSMDHIKKVFDMLRQQTKPIIFSGGLDAELFTEEHAKLIRSIKAGELWFACDYPGGIKHLEKVRDLLPDFNARKRRVYTLIGFNGEKISQASSRLEKIYKMGFWPYAMLYRSPYDLKRNKWSLDWLKLQNLWTRPARFKTYMGDN